MKLFYWLVSIVVMVVICIVVGAIFLQLLPNYDVYVGRGDSMKPVLNEGDLLIHRTQFESLNEEIRPGTIVTYEFGKLVVTHRVVSVNSDIILTKGDANEDIDPWLVPLDNVKGVYSFRIPCVGYLVGFVQTKLGYSITIPAMALLMITLLNKNSISKHKGRMSKQERSSFTSGITTASHIPK